MLKKIAAILIIITWPLSMYLANTFPNFIHYLIPPLLSLLCYFLWKQKIKYFFLPLFILPFIEPKFSVLPFLFLIIYYRQKILNKENMILLLISTVLILITWKSFIGQTVFLPDYQASQTNLQKSNLYNSVILARIFQNKLKTPVDKISNNFFQIVDPNNYFFGFAPRQIVIDDQNTLNLPFLAIPFLLTGIYFIQKYKDYEIILALAISKAINLSVLNIYDRNDFIIWIPLCLVALFGLNIFDKKFKYAKYYEFVFIIFSVIEISRLVFIK